MMKKYGLLFIAALAWLAFPSPAAYAAEKPKCTFSAKVKVSVAGQEKIVGAVGGYLAEALRALPDVELVAEGHQFEISILAGELTCEEKTKTGFAFSILIIEPFDCSLVAMCADRRYVEFFKSMTADLAAYPKWHWLRVGGPQDLPEMCKKIVADFDSQILEQRRRVFQKMNPQ
jgi:hypothetical protein